MYPFKINQHIIDLIDWDHYHFDPLFQLTFPQPDMLLPDELIKIEQMLDDNCSR